MVPNEPRTTIPQLLIVDDDVQLAAMLQEFLELDGFRVQTVGSGEAALQQLHELAPELIILDVMLPGMDGFAVLGCIKATHDTPVIMLTARGEESERIHGLTGGADDYLPKPFNPLELAARIRNVLKRSRAAEKAQQALQAGPLHMDLQACELTVNTQPVALTAAEMRLLEQLMRQPGVVLSRARLTELALDREIEAYDRSIDTLISKLRKKLGAAGIAGDCIRNLRGHGYVLDEERLR